MAGERGKKFTCEGIVFLGLIVRLFLMYSPSKEWFTDRIELSTPLTSWRRLQEGLSLLSHGVSPYNGDSVHETPLVLLMFLGLKQLSSQLALLVFVAVDILVGISLYRLAHLHTAFLLSEQKKQLKLYADSVDPILINPDAIDRIPSLVVAVFLLNPYTIGSCVAQSSGLFANLPIVLGFYFALKGQTGLSMLGVAIATYLSLYPVVLLVPFALVIVKVNNSSKSNNDGDKVDWTLVLKAISIYIIWISALVGISYAVCRSWDFLYASYGCILLVPDLTPNMGLFWYFFTEMFEHFRIFFLWVYQLNAFFYCIPLSIRLRNYPTFLVCLLCAIMSIMKSYPAFGDASLPFALMAMWLHVFPYMRNTFFVACLFLFSSFLGPVFWYLWIYAGSANANFFFAITLVYSTAQILLYSDVAFAFLRREYDLYHGIYPKIVDGEVAAVTLK